MKDAMDWLGQQPDTLFLGQGVGMPGTKMSKDFEGVPAENRIEMPVAENFQLGVSIGLALEGFMPVSIFPRINFLLCAVDQLVNHLDKLPLYSEYKPKVIIRTTLGVKEPIDAGPQHTGDLGGVLVAALETVEVHRIYRAEYKSGWDLWDEDLKAGFDADPLLVYQGAYLARGSTLVIEG